MFSRHPLSAALACAATAALASTQGLPDCLIGDTGASAEMVRRLVDRNQDGRWDTALGSDEVYDFYRANQNFDPQDIVLSPWNPSVLYMIDGDTAGSAASPAGGIYMMRDANADGVIDASEISFAFDPLVAWATSDAESEAMVTDGRAIYFVTNAGNNEGVWRCEDLNGDGDFMDNVMGVDETRPALVEAGSLGGVGSNAHPIANCPLTDAAAPGTAVLDPSEIQRIGYVPPASVDGALPVPGIFLIEDENLDQTLGLRDLTADGDFMDPGELFLYAGLNTNVNASNPIHRDANPDVTPAGALPLGADVGNFAVDARGAVPIVYMLDKSTSGGSANVIYRARDGNADGDCNDAGEVTVFFQALNTDPTIPTQLGSVAISIWNGDVFLCADSDVGFNHDSIYRLHDANLDGRIDNATEATRVWDLAFDGASRMPNLFALGVLTPAPAGPAAFFEYQDAVTCGMTLNVGGLTPFDFVPVIGGSFALNTTGAPANAMAAYHLGNAVNPPLALDMPATCFYSVDPWLAVPATASASGAFPLNLTVTSGPGFAGSEVFFQSLAVDLGANPYNVRTSNRVRIRFGFYSYTIPSTRP